MSNGFRPSKNSLTQGFSFSHPGHDFSGKGDDGVYAYESGLIVTSRDLYTTNWLQGKEGDPTPWGLTTDDFGNFLKIKHDNGTFSLYAHLKHKTPLSVNTRVEKGQRLASIGNTGNSTGFHLHFEVRDKNDKTVEPKYEELMQENTLPVDKKVFEELVAKSTKFDALKAVGVEVPKDVETLKQALGEAQAERTVAKQEAEYVRSELKEFKTQTAEKLQSTQDLPRILSAIQDIIDKQDALQKQSDKDSEENRAYEAQISELQSEVTRLKVMLESTNPLSQATALELLQELFKRFSHILSKS